MKQGKDENEASEEDADEYGQENLTGTIILTHALHEVNSCLESYHPGCPR